MFDLVFDAFGAFNQAGLMLGGFLCLGLGGLILGNDIYWRFKGQRARGTIIGVRQKGKVYYPVYRYVSPEGDVVEEATSDSGSSILKGKETGREVELVLFPGERDKVREAGGIAMPLVGLALAAPGVALFYAALASHDVTPMTFGMLGFFLLLIFARARKFIIPTAERKPPDEWRAQRRARRRAERAALPIVRVEDLESSPAFAEQKREEAKNARVAAPLVLLFAFGLLGGGIYLGQEAAQLEARGLRAPGRVVSMESSRDPGGDTTYYPVVRFESSGGGDITFRDSMGSSPPLYRTGEDVTVLYLEDDPEESAAIDRGAWNWALPGGLALFGCLMFLLFFSLMRRMRRDEAR